MSKISIYEVAPVPKLADKLIGTSVGGVIEDITYNFTLQELLTLFIPNIPQNTLQGVLDYGNTATQNINLTGTINTTTLNVGSTATILNSYLTGETHITGGLYDRLNSLGTAGQVLRSTGTKVEWYSVPTVIPNLQQVLASGNTADIDIILDADIQAFNINTNTASVFNQLILDGSLRDYNGYIGAAGQVLSSTGSAVAWVNLPVYTATSPLSIDSITKVLSIQKADGTHDGYLSSLDWITFSGKQDAISLTTSGSSGPATYISNTINVPNYTLAGLGGVPQTRILTINGVSYNLSADRTWTIPSGIGSVGATAPLSSTGGGNPVISISQANSSTDGYLSSTDWVDFNTAYNDSIVSAAVTGTTTKLLTLNQQDGGTITASWSDDNTGLTSVGVSMPSAFSVSNSPLTSNGTIAIAGSGTNLEYIDGTGALRTFPGLTGYVPYIGATGPVNLGPYNLTVNTVIVGRGTSTHPTNIAIGNSNTMGIYASTGTSNVAIGNDALAFVTTGYENTAIGNNSLLGLTQGYYNVGIGAESGGYNQLGNNNTFIGRSSGANIRNGSGNTIIGGWQGDISTSNNVVLSDGYGNLRYRYDGTNNNFYQNVNFASTLGNGTYTYTLPSATGTIALVGDLSGYVPTSRTLSINGVTYDLSADRSWTITSGVSSVFGRTGNVVAEEGDYSLAQLSDVTLTTPSTGQVLKYSGTEWVNSSDIGLTSVGVSMPSAFTVSNSPLTSNGTIAITGAGIASQYIRGDGQLANFPTNTGGGSSVSYYLNGGTSQGIIVGNPYYEMSKNAVVGTNADFNINTDGYIANFITDAGDPALLQIPGGNWDFEIFFSTSSSGGTPTYYVELYKYDGTTFTLIADNSSNPEGITGGTAIDLYVTALAVPETTLTLTDRLAIRVYVSHSGRTITLHTQGTHLCQIITTFSTGISALNGLTEQVQYFATGTAGSDFAVNSSIDTHTFNLPTASATNRGALSTTDWTTFNDKIGGVGTTNYLPKFTGSSSIGNSIAYDGGSSIGINTNAPYDSSQFKLDVNGGLLVKNTSGVSAQFVLINANPAGGGNEAFIIQSVGGTSSASWAQLQTYYGLSVPDGALRLQPSAGQVLIGTVVPSAYMLDVNGTIRATGQLTLGSTISNGTYTYNLPSATGTIALVSDLNGYVPTSRTLTINGVTYDLSADRSWTITAGVSSVTATSPLFSSGGANPNLTIQPASVIQDGYLSSSDWNTFNSKVSGSGTTNFLPKFTGSGTIGDSVAYDGGSSIGINTTAPYDSSQFKLDVNGGLIIKNTSGTSAQLVLINSNPAGGGNNGFIIHSVGGTSSDSWAQLQTYYGIVVPDGALRLQPSAGQVLVGTTTASTFKVDINGTVRITGQLRLGSTITNGSYTYTLPSGDGTIALTSDIPSLAGYVTIATNQTITGDKILNGNNTFNGINTFTTNQTRFTVGIALDNTYSGGSVGGHTVLGSTASGLQVNLTGGAYNNLNFTNTTIGHTYTFPDADGTIALASSLSSYVPTSRTLSINGVSYDLSADRSWTITSGISSVSGTAPISVSTVSGAATVSITQATTSTDGYLSSSDWTTFNNKVPPSRTLTINGTTYDLSANRSWTISSTSASTRTVQKFTSTAGQTIFTISGGYTVGMVDVYVNGVKLDNATGVDYTATDGTTVELTTALTVNQIVEVYIYGSQFVPNNALRQVTSFTATAGQTAFTVSYSVGLVDVYYNGSCLAPSEYTAIDGTSISLGTACQVNDIVVVYAYSYIVGAFSGISGSGTTNYLSKFTSSGVIGNSVISDNGTAVSVAGDLNVTGTGGTISVPVAVEYLVVGGGGGGGADLGGGGGAGGFLAGTTYLSKGTFSVVQVGNGGRGAGSSGGLRIAEPGGNSSLFGIIAYGGGGGGYNINVGTPGASGGGASRNGLLGGTSLYPNQGFAGGNGGTGSPYYVGGGGGGAAAAGGNGSTNAGGNGGAGLSNSITGSSVYYAGGGGGAGYGGGGGTGGVGGGGNGSSSSSGQTNGTANTGGGGGGGGNISGIEGANGGSGIVIIKYADTYPTSTCTGTFTYAVSGGFRRYTFTGNGTIKLMA